MRCVMLCVVLCCLKVKSTKIGLMNGNINCKLPAINVGTLTRNVALHLHLHYPNSNCESVPEPVHNYIIKNHPQVAVINPIADEDYQSTITTLPEKIHKPIDLDVSHDTALIKKYSFLRGKTVRLARNVTHDSQENETDNITDDNGGEDHRDVDDGDTVNNEIKRHYEMNEPTRVIHTNNPGTMVQRLAEMLFQSNVPLGLIGQVVNPDENSIGSKTKTNNNLGTQVFASILKLYSMANQTNKKNEPKPSARLVKHAKTTSASTDSSLESSTKTTDCHQSKTTIASPMIVKKTQAQILREQRAEQRRLRRLATAQRAVKIQNK